MKNNRFARFAMVMSIGIMLLAVTGCRRHNPANSGTEMPTTGTHEAPTGPAPLTDDQLKQARPNEAGQVPIFVYYDILSKAPKNRASTNRTPAQFRKDLERLYKENYRPIGISDYLNNKIDIPFGTKPVILTFDDSLPSQFAYKPDGAIDPDCAVGILLAFNKEHTDFPIKAVFYVLPDHAFGDPDDAGKKLQQLLDMGCEIGNRTVTRHSLRRMTDDRVKNELATAVAKIKELAPKAVVDTLAPPLGASAHNLAIEKDGAFNGSKYHNRAVLIPGARPASVPYARSFDPLKVPRILAVEGAGGITNWLNQLQISHKSFVSDGDAAVTTIPKNLLPKIDKSKLNGASLRTY